MKIIRKYRNRDYIIGIDLHGTLLDEQWEIKDALKHQLIKQLNVVRQIAKVFVCSGNDITFIYKYIPEDIRSYFDGYILETGCVISDGTDEKIIIPKELTIVIKELEAKLKEINFKEVKYFGRRLITITMFTKDEYEGLDPAEFYPKALKVVKDLGFEDKVLVTHSNVAIDIIPKGYNKFTGLKYLAGELKTIGIADSLNDLDLIIDADYAFIPANASISLIKKLKSLGKKLVTIESKQNSPHPNLLPQREKEIKFKVEDNDSLKGVVWQSKYNETKGVIDILQFINFWL